MTVSSVMSFESAVSAVIRLRKELATNPLVRSVGLTRHDGREAVRINMAPEATDTDLISLPSDSEVQVVPFRLPR